MIDFELDRDTSFTVVSSVPAMAASYGKKNGIWYAAPGGQGWSKAPSRKASIIETDVPPPGGGSNIKPSSGRVIRIINNMDHTVQCRVLLNLRTTQPFEEVLEDLGQVLKMNGAKRMYTVSGQEVRSFSQLRNEFADADTFYLGVGPVGGAVMMSPIRRSRSRQPQTAIVEDISKQRRARSKSRPRTLYAPESEIVRNSGKPIFNETIAITIQCSSIRLYFIRSTKRGTGSGDYQGLKEDLYPPIHHAPMENSPPEKKMQLEWVYGYRGTDSRRNLWVLPTGELLYFVAAVAVMYDRDEEAQRHYTGHTEDIQCMDLHPSREMVASGQKAGRNRKTQAHIRIWSTETLQTLYVFGMGEFEVGVAAVAFSQLNGGSYVLAVDGGRESILSVWQWQWGHLLGKVAPSRTLVTSLQFEQDGDVITADSDGFITIYSVDSDGAYFVRMEFEAHNKGVSSLVMLSEGTLLSGGEKDRKIAAWDSLQNYKRITDTKLPEAAGGVRSIYPQRPGRNDGNIYVGTTKNNILEGSLQRRFNQVVFGHGRQLWGLAVHPDDELFATAGHDKNIALWRKNKLLWTTQVGYECISLCFHPFGIALAAGSTEGHLIILNAESGAVGATVRVCGSPLNCVGYNPGGDLIAIASQNGSVYVFRVSRDGFSYKKSNKIRGSQPLMQLDWSTDSNYVQTVTADYDLSFWDIKSLSPEKSPIAMKDTKWYTHNSTVGFLVAGVWNNRFYPMSSVISTASRSSAHDLLICGDTDGYLRLFRFPVLSTKAEYNEEKLYSGTVACARFLFNDRNIVTVGGTDAGLMLWELTEE
ncbi:wd-40 repeat protein [Holotrichia oblita]|uniref:Wd-40 repeat protein n=1 Tax=Holotrichia oblita TaxID=644536 RepID=A0ACB9T2G6_HOLOL|nr:wd-40 repeat protein [Holotrichia oblita]